MKFTPLAIPDVVSIEPHAHEDRRGFFFESYHANEFRREGIPTHFVQDNHSGSNEGVLRGLHFQLRRPQGKLVRVVVGEVYDVAVDLRRTSPTVGQYVGQTLSAKNRRQLWIPPGFAHGFYCLSDWSEVLYKVTEFYRLEWDRTLRWDDPNVGVDWPLINGRPPLLSPKDRRGAGLGECETYEN